MADELERSDYPEGCPIATAALDTRRNPTSSARWPATPSVHGSSTIKRGLFRLGLTAGDADLAATMVLCQLEGALLLARTYRSLEPLRRAEQAVRMFARLGKRDG